MWTDQKQQFVEAAAPAMWQEAYRAHVRTKECVLCPHPADRHQKTNEARGVLSPFAPPYDVMCRDCRATNRNMDSVAHYHRATRFDDLTEMQQRTHVPLTPRVAEFTAAELLGMIEQANGCELSVIIEAAETAQAEQADPVSCRVCDCRNFSIGLGGKSIGCECLCHVEFSVAEFARLIALEAIGAGPKWTDEHAEFNVGRTPSIGCPECTGALMGEKSSGYAGYRCTDCHMWWYAEKIETARPFVVPRFEFKYQT